MQDGASGSMLDLPLPRLDPAADRTRAGDPLPQQSGVKKNGLSRPVTVVIPAYGAADRLAVCVRSLLACTPDAISFYVVDDGTPDDSIQQTCARENPGADRVQYVRRPENRGFVETCNWAFEHLRPRGADLLLLNSDIEATPGFLEEMQAVLDADEKHGVVSPRSNNATLMSVPPVGSRLPADEAYSVWKSICKDLPRFHVLPTANGFCLLIKSTVLDCFGKLFDPVYSPGYNEENDFICRINRYGYSAVAANWAFVFHYESSSFSTRRHELEERNSRVLQQRYPEYMRKVDEYFALHVDPVDYFSALKAPHHPRLLVDLSHIPAAYNGTAEYALKLLGELKAVQSRGYDIHVGVQRGPGADFFARELSEYQTYEYGTSNEQVFDAVFKPSQFFTWEEYARLTRLAPRIAFTMQDIIGVRCEYLNTAYRRQLFLATVELSDLIFSISQYSQRDFCSFYGIERPMTVIHHGTDVEPLAPSNAAGKYVLVIGNHYAHKAVSEALDHLEDDLPVVVLGGSDSRSTRANINWHASGHLSRDTMNTLYAEASVIVYPSQYEGFGLPIIDALTLGKPVIAMNTAINRELAAALQDGNLHLVDTYVDLPSTIASLRAKGPEAHGRKIRRWRDVAADYDAALQSLLNTEVDLQRLRSRWSTVATITAISSPSGLRPPVVRRPLWRRIAGRIRRTARSRFRQLREKLR